LNTQKQIFLIVVLFFTFVGACGAYAVVDLPIRAEDQAQWHEKEEIERGALLFANNCRTCHGNKGEGGIGLPLNIDKFKDEDPLVLAANTELLTRTLQCGRAGTMMQPWLDGNGGALNERQVEHLVKLITAPATDTDPDTGQLTNRGWLEAEEFAHNLNRETAVVVGGSTLDTVADEHHIGQLELARLNNLDPNATVQKGTVLNLPPTPGKENRTFKVTDTGSLSKVANRTHAGAITLANLNGIPYRYNDETQVMTLLDDAGNPVTGLFPGTELALPEYAVYAVRAGDTLDSIAERHGITVSELRSANSGADLPSDAEEQLPFERMLELPSGTQVLAQAGDTVGSIATRHGLEPEDLLAVNPDLTAESILVAGQQVQLPEDAVYIVQSGDTLESIAAEHPGTTAAGLAEQNNVDAGTAFGPEIILQLPPVDAYVLQGQSLDDLAETFSNVRASELAEANGIPSNAILRVGQQLRLPDSAWGSAAGDALNPGTACVQHIVPTSVFEELSGTGEPTPEVERPSQMATDLVIEANSNDWTFVVDGERMTPNEGVALIAAGTDVRFVTVLGRHNIVLNGEVQGEDINTGDERTVTFGEPGQFTVTCDYHPAMFGTVFVE